MTNPGSKGEFDRLKAELQRLKRAQAPWYFESSLHQRLHGGRRPRVRHAPFRFGFAITVSFFSLAIVALAVYLVFLNSTLFQPAAPVQDAVSAPFDSTSAIPSGGIPAQEGRAPHVPPATKMERPEGDGKDLPRLNKLREEDSVNFESDSAATGEKRALLPEEVRKATSVDTTRRGSITGGGDQTPKSKPDSLAATKAGQRTAADTATADPHPP